MTLFRSIHPGRQRFVRWTAGATIAFVVSLISAVASAVLVPTLPPFIAFLNTTCSDAGAATGFVSISLGNPDGDEGGARTYAWALNEFDGAIGPLVDAGDVVVENGSTAPITAGPVAGGQYVFTAYDVALPDLEVSTDLIITQCPPPPSTTTTSTTTSTSTSTTTTTVVDPTTTIVDPTTSIGAIPTTLPPNPTEPPAATGQTLPATGGSPAVAAIAGIVLAGGAVATAAARLRRPRA